MADALHAVDSAISEVGKARNVLQRSQSKQVTKKGDLQYFASVAYAWLETHRAQIAGTFPQIDLASVNDCYSGILHLSGKSAARSSYDAALKQTKQELTKLRLAVFDAAVVKCPLRVTPSPDFSSLAADPAMQEILKRRWLECQLCFECGAFLAATVMMGGLLEALFVARANTIVNKKPLFTAKSTPIDKKSKVALPLKDWTLRPYIAVGEELGWICNSGKAVAQVLCEYRNYIHPEKERTDGVMLTERDVSLFWEITKQLTAQLLIGP
jgi:hypothetical protein